MLEKIKILSSNILRIKIKLLPELRMYNIILLDLAEGGLEPPTHGL